MCSSRKLSMRLRGTNFCSSSARFAPSFIRQPNGPECTQLVANALKRKFRVHWGGSGAFVAKIPTRLRGTNFCTSSSRFAPSFVRQPNGFRMHPNSTKRTKSQFRVQWGGSGVFDVKNFDATSWHEPLHLFGPFCNEFCKATKQSRMHPNSTNKPKRQYIVQWGGSGAFLAKCST